MVSFQHYARLANEARLQAEMATDPAIRAQFLEQAARWQKLVERVQAVEGHHAVMA